MRATKFYDPGIYQILILFKCGADETGWRVEKFICEILDILELSAKCLLDVNELCL